MIQRLTPLFTGLLIISVLLVQLPVLASSPEPVRGRHAMVASQHQLASNIGSDVMKKGGNAVDAAIAVGLALAVVYPEAGNIGGGGFMLIRRPNGEAFVIDYREMAPKAASRNMYVDDKGEIIKDLSTIGYRGVGVPGTMAGFELAYRKYGSGRIKWRDLVRPARLLAQNGYVLSHRLAELFKEYRSTLEKFEDSKRIFLNGGKLFQEGDILRQSDLARTLLRIERLGAREFYTGTSAKLIADDMRANGGLITLDDLRSYKAKERIPLRGTYRGHEIVSVPPPSSGGS